MAKKSQEKAANESSALSENSRLSTEQPFSYQQRKDGKIHIAWHGRQVMVLKGKNAERFLNRIKGKTADEEQLAMAAVTGYFKRGNERLAQSKEKNR